MAHLIHMFMRGEAIQFVTTSRSKLRQFLLEWYSAKDCSCFSEMGLDHVYSIPENTVRKTGKDSATGSIILFSVLLQVLESKGVANVEEGQTLHTWLVNKKTEFEQRLRTEDRWIRERPDSDDEHMESL